jgi:hypothetical protein
VVQCSPDRSSVLQLLQVQKRFCVSGHVHQPTQAREIASLRTVFSHLGAQHAVGNDSTTFTVLQIRKLIRRLSNRC